MDLSGRVALVTGASSGMGVEFARQLARDGAALVLVARRRERLEGLAAELRELGVEADVVPCDLSAEDGVDSLLEELRARGLEPDVLINNAGAGLHRKVHESDWQSQRSQLHLNVTALVQLTHAFAGRMKERGGGHILNVSSIGAYLPVPGFAVYAASKAFVRNFTEALAYEVAGAGVRVCCLCPGGIATEFFDVSGQKLPGVAKLALMSPERCARIGLRALFGGRHNIVSGLSNSLGMWLLRFVPRWLMVRLGYLVMGPTPALPDGGRSPG